MPAYKLVYFNVKGRAEMTRLLFAAAGTKYEDCRVNGEEFQKLRDSGKLPFDKVPILEVDGKTLSQSINILQYVSRETGFSPKESFEIAKADMVVDGLSDISEKAIVFFTEKDEEKQKVLKKEYYEKLPNVMGKCEALLKSSGGKYFADNKLTYADIYFFSFLDTLFPDVLNKIPAVLENCPMLKDLFCRIRDNPGIKEWLQTRPDQS